MIIIGVAVFIISCSDMEKSSFENKPLAIKKETNVSKSKKKKQKIKPATTKKTKAKTIPAKDEERR